MFVDVCSCTGLRVFQSHLNDLSNITVVFESLQLQLSSAHQFVCLKQASEKTRFQGWLDFKIDWTFAQLKERFPVFSSLTWLRRR